MSSKVIFGGIGVGAVMVLLFPISNLFLDLSGDLHLGTTDSGSPAFRAASEALVRRCAACHTHRARKPFYSTLPYAQAMIERDIELGLDWLDLDEAFAGTPGAPVNEAALAKIQHSVERHTMPPLPFKLLHWDAGFTHKEHAAVLVWLEQERAQHFKSPASPEHLQAHILQPIPGPRKDLDIEKIALGDRLYHDVRLSKDNTISCASCHDLTKGGTDRAQFSTGVNDQLGDINAPTVFNAVMQLAQFWDGRAADLREQADGPPTNPIEMASNWPEIVGKLEADAEFKEAFEAVYHNGFSKQSITDAIASFEEILVTPNSPFDRYLLGENDILSPEAAAGYTLYMQHSCASCHVGMAMGGQSYEKLGIAADYFGDRGHNNKADQGRFNVTGRGRDIHRFKVPILRNIALTSPYFHDGTVQSLEEAVSLMGTYQLGLDFTPTEKKQLVAFLEAQTGELGRAGISLR